MNAGADASLDEHALFARLCKKSHVNDDILMSLIAQGRGEIVSFMASDAGLSGVTPTDAAVQNVCALVHRRHGVHITNDDVTRVRQLAMTCFACMPAAQMRQAAALGAVPVPVRAPFHSTIPSKL